MRVLLFQERIKAAAPWADDVEVFETAETSEDYRWLATAHGSRIGEGAYAINARAYGRTGEAAVSRLEDVLKGGSK